MLLGVLAVIASLDIVKHPTITDVQVTDAFGTDVRLTTLDTAADPELEEARKAIATALSTLDAARKLALELRTDDAIRRFEEALNLFGRGITALEDYTPMAQAYLELGAACIDSRRDKDAIAAFRRSAALGKGVKPNPKIYNPDVIKRFAKVEAEIARAVHGSMNVVTRPDNAEVFVDGRNVGLSPVSLSDLVIGEHWLVVRLPGHHRFSARVAVGAGKVEKTEVYLRALPVAEDPLKKLTPPVLLIVRGTGGYRGQLKLADGVKTLDAKSLDDLAGLVRAALPKGASVLSPSVPSVMSPTPLTPSSDRPVALQTATAPAEALAARKDVHPVVALLPFGIGQFAEGRYGVGALFLTTEVLLLAANITSVILVYTDLIPNSAPRQWNNPERSVAFQWVANISLGVLIADMIIGGIDGILHRKAPQ